MPNPRLKDWPILPSILLILVGLLAIGLGVHEGLKTRHYEFQELVLISGVMDSFETVLSPDCPWIKVLKSPPCFFDMILGPSKRRSRSTDDSGHSIEELRLRLRGDPHLYVIDPKVIEGFNWKKFSAKKPVSTSVSLKVEQAQLSQWKPSGRRRRIMVYELESSSGTYLTTEDSLREIRADAIYFVIPFGFGALFLIFPVVAICCKRHSFLGRIFLKHPGGWTKSQHSPEPDLNWRSLVLGGTAFLIGIAMFSIGDIYQIPVLQHYGRIALLLTLGFTGLSWARSAQKSGVTYNEGGSFKKEKSPIFYWFNVIFMYVGGISAVLYAVNVFSVGY